MRLIFMGTPAFALPALQTLIDSDHEVVAVYSQPPRPSGRGQKRTPSAIHQLAEKNGIPVFTPISLKTDDAQSEFSRHGADIAVVAAYGLILPAPVLRAPKHGCINIHPSALPRWRGAAPIQRTIMAGDTQTDCCIMQMDEGLDTGDVLMRQAYDIPDDQTAGELHDIMAEMGAEMTFQVLEKIEENKIAPKAQSNNGVTYADKINKAELEIDWSRSAQDIHNQIRGLSPAPAAYSCIGDERVKMLESSLCNAPSNLPSGSIEANNGLFITAGDGKKLQIQSVKRPGKAAQQISDILINWPLPEKVNMQ